MNDPVPSLPAVLTFAASDPTSGAGLQADILALASMGCYPLSGAVESNASTVEEIVAEMLLTKTSERQGRAIDRDAGSGSMEKKKQEGYF